MGVDANPDGTWTLAEMRRLRGTDLRPVADSDAPGWIPEAIEHVPTRGRYKQGCRCDGCRAANAAYVAETRQKAAIGNTG